MTAVAAPGLLLPRGDHRHLRTCVEAAGYDGPIEVEIFNADLWDRPGAEVLEEVIASYRTHVAPS